MRAGMLGRSAVLLSLSLMIAGAVGGYELKSRRVEAHARAVSVKSDLIEVRDLIVALEPKLREKRDDLQTAILLRNFIHQRIPLWSERGVEKFEDYDFRDIDGTFTKSVLDDRYGHKCGGFVIEYLVALKAFGLTARKVGMYPEVDDLPKVPISHASVGVLIGGKWVAQDPYFNISLRSPSGEALGWFDVAKLGEAVPDHDGFPAKQSFEKFLKKVDIASLTRNMNAADNISPSNWDGVLRYRDGHTFNVLEADQSGVYGDLD